MGSSQEDLNANAFGCHSPARPTSVKFCFIRSRVSISLPRVVRLLRLLVICSALLALWFSPARGQQKWSRVEETVVSHRAAIVIVSGGYAQMLEPARGFNVRCLDLEGGNRWFGAGLCLLDLVSCNEALPGLENLHVNYASIASPTLYLHPIEYVTEDSTLVQFSLGLRGRLFDQFALSGSSDPQTGATFPVEENDEDWTIIKLPVSFDSFLRFQILSCKHFDHTPPFLLGLEVGYRSLSSPIEYDHLDGTPDRLSSGGMRFAAWVGLGGGSIYERDTTRRITAPGPELRLSVARDTDSESLVQPGEAKSIPIILKNSGNGQAEDVEFEVSWKPRSDDWAVALRDSRFARIEAHRSVRTTLQIKNLRQRELQPVNIRLQAHERDGFRSNRIDHQCHVGSQKPPLPASLSIESVKLIDPNDNQTLDALETAEVLISIRNDGRGPGHILVRILENSVPRGFEVICDEQLGRLDPGKSAELPLQITGGRNLPTGEARIEVVFADEYYATEARCPLRIPTGAYRAPEVDVTIQSIDDSQTIFSGNDHNQTLEPGELVRVVLRVQNRGIDRSPALRTEFAVDADEELVHFRRSLDEEDALSYDDRAYELGTLLPGEERTISFYLFVAPAFSKETVRMTARVIETARHADTVLQLDLPIQRRVRSSEPDVASGTGSADNRLIDGTMLQTNPQRARVRLAVMPLRASTGISEGEAEILTGMLEAAIFNTNTFTLVPRRRLEEVAELLEIELAICAEGACLIRLGTYAGAEEMIVGEVGQFLGSYRIAVRRHSLQHNEFTTVGAASVSFSGSEDCDEGIVRIAAELARSAGQ